MSRVTVTKRWTGDIVGTSTAHLLTAMSPVRNSAGYVAMERMDVSIAGRSGTFVLQHSAISFAGNAELSVTVVPDTGTAELATLSGTLFVTVVGREEAVDRGGQHLYEFAYDLTG